MTPFYMVSGLWVLTVVLWQVQVHFHHRERMATLKLFKANSLTEYEMGVVKSPAGSKNFIHDAIQNANRRTYAEDDEDD